MEREFIKETRHSVTLNVTAGRIDSFRELERTTGTVRVYDGGCVGVAGCLGEPDENALTKKAEEALAFSIPYPCRPEAPLVLEDLREEEIIPVPAFIPTMQDFLDRLGALCPRFAISNKISLRHDRSEYRSSAGRRMLSSGSELSIDLVVQSRGSGNLFDTGLFWSGTRFDAEKLLGYFKTQYDAFFTPADLKPGRWPVVMDASGLFGTFLRNFVGDMYVSGASLLSGKLGQKAFSDILTLRDDMNPDTAPGACFFDAEGCTAPDFRPTLIENGVLTGLLTTKKTAAKYGLPNLGTASAAYDGVPGAGFHRFYPEPTAKSIREMIPGKAVYVMVASGGDTTPDGHFATPVQMAYLLEDGQLVGRLPEFAVSGEFSDLLGKDYIGSVHGDLQDDAVLSAAYMEVTKD